MSKALFPVQSSKVSRKKRTALIGQGQRMSNWLYNIKQLVSTPPLLRKEAAMLQEDWDQIKNSGDGDK